MKGIQIDSRHLTRNIPLKSHQTWESFEHSKVHRLYSENFKDIRLVESEPRWGVFFFWSEDSCRGTIWESIFHPFELPKTNGSPLKIGRAPKRNDRIPTIHFQVRAVSFREGRDLTVTLPDSISFLNRKT